MRNRYAKNILCMTAVFCAAAVIGCGTKTVKDSDVVMEIAGQTVVKAEYQMILVDYESEIKRQYDTDMANREDFWTSKEGGERPLDKIMQLAEEELKEKKTIAQLTADLGIDAQADYGALAAQVDGENDARGAADESGGNVYGITAFQMREYYDYVYTQLEYEVMESLKKNHEASREELQKIYQENQQAYTSDVSVKMLVAELQAESGNGQASQAESGNGQASQAGSGNGQASQAGSGNEQILQAMEDLKESTDMQYLRGKYPNINFYELEMSSLNMEEGKSGVYMQRWLTASAMQQGEVCQPFAVGENLLAMRCLERSEHSVQPFEEVEGLLKDDVQTNGAYEEIESRQKEAEIKLIVTQGQLEKIALEALQIPNK